MRSTQIAATILDLVDMNNVQGREWFVIHPPEERISEIAKIIEQARPNLNSKATAYKVWYELNRALAVIRHPESFEVDQVCRDIELALKSTGGFICGDWQHVSEWKNGKQLVARCDLDQNHEGRHQDSVIAISWENPPVNCSNQF